MQDAFVLIARKQHGLFGRGKDGDGGGLLSLLIFLQRGGVIHIKPFGIGNGQHFHKTQLRDVGYGLQHVVVIIMVEPDDVAALQLVGERCRQRLGCDGDGHHAVRDLIEGKVRGQRDAADLFRQDVVAGIKVCCSVGACHVLDPPGNAVRQVEAANFHDFKVSRSDGRPTGNGSLHADDLTGAAGPAGDGRDGDECDDGSEHDAQDAVDESVVHFHNGNKKSSVFNAFIGEV